MCLGGREAGGGGGEVLLSGCGAVLNCTCLIKTQSAVDKVRQLLSKNTEAIGLKVGVRQRGCNGLSYTLQYTAEKSKFDEEVMQDGVKIIIDKKAQLTLLGTEMDYVTSKLSSEFVFNNPNIKGTCGCGESFSI
ncbi:Iron-sulfur cluster assembly 1, mitochondrial [Chionoecetes opilio]|uniref:Iron-sulfur cluster assembly 1 homolog, mitochondrial n=1 Tax=Chionoecetes opilio TaxID=41210 RepID=A0A8J5CMN0_CHIOP|nr:Iron-sulfur cluster assembly 1, mitochondrial [Chionoecetes opilio]